ncbi:eukaryotic translation initiation factor 4 gamma 3-like [Pleuronectes platessa]|uniref:eukaryotic translation initiation factor 4 gamma 3-like n=1 Tax=Pleuronectes platessa TaxID=8262 RepID=UPI00232A2B89|nr:eukaryotic translation initiation factor 4 gamma 3-like [Pleuronectes platessa]
MNETCLLVTYAKMCSCLATLTVPCTDKPQDTVNFRKLLISRCHMEFQKEKVEDVVKDFSQRRYIGNIKFIGELYKVKMLNDFIVHDCLDKLLMNQDELALECLCVLLTTISKDLELDETKVSWW